MRDALLLAVFAGLMPVALFRPWIGAMVFLCVSVMNPHRLAWGIAAELPLAQISALVTLGGAVFTKDRDFIGALRQYWPMLLYVFWAGITTTFALVPDHATDRFNEFVKIHIMTFVTLMLVTDRHKLRWLVLILTGSVVFYGIKGGVFTLATGGQFLVWGPPKSNIEENNALAVALLMFVPLLFALRTWATRRSIRAALLCAASLCLISALGSYSRGALLAGTAMLGMLWWRSRNRLVSGFALTVCVAVAIPFLPNHWWERMETISTYETDGSAMGRVYAWITATNVANARLTGGGFDYYGREASALYGARPDEFQAAHSIYFQSLGEHGWLGLAIFLAFWMGIWVKSRRLVRVLRSDKSWEKEAAIINAISIGLVAYAVGGAFIQFGNWDGAYYFASIVLVCGRLYMRFGTEASTQADARRLGKKPGSAVDANHGGRIPVKPI